MTPILAYPCAQMNTTRCSLATIRHGDTVETAHHSHDHHHHHLLCWIFSCSTQSRMSSCSCPQKSNQVTAQVGVRNGTGEWTLGAVQENGIGDCRTGTSNMLNCEVEGRRRGGDVREEQDPICIHSFIHSFIH